MVQIMGLLVKKIIIYFGNPCLNLCETPGTTELGGGVGCESPPQGWNVAGGH